MQSFNKNKEIIMAKILVEAFSEVATADLASLGEQKKGLDDVQKFLMRFGYLQIGTFKSGELGGSPK